jgi:hypothetical protein
MTLGQKQEHFSRLLTLLEAWIGEQPGMEVRRGDCYRDPRAHGEFGEDGPAGYGSPNSFHKLKLAQDLNLTIDGVYQETTEAHRVIGEYWKSLDPICTWGGDFNSPDGNHYSYGEGR